MATLTVEKSGVTGLNPVTENAANGGGDDFPNNGSTIAYIKNGSGGAITVTVDGSGLAAPAGAVAFDADVDVVIGAGDDAVIGPFPTGRFTASVGLTYSGVTSLTVSPVDIS